MAFRSGSKIIHCYSPKKMSMETKQMVVQIVLNSNNTVNSLNELVIDRRYVASCGALVEVIKFEKFENGLRQYSVRVILTGKKSKT